MCCARVCDPLRLAGSFGIQQFCVLAAVIDCLQYRFQWHVVLPGHLLGRSAFCADGLR